MDWLCVIGANLAQMTQNSVFDATSAANLLIPHCSIAAVALILRPAMLSYSIHDLY